MEMILMSHWSPSISGESFQSILSMTWGLDCSGHVNDISVNKLDCLSKTSFSVE
jgi:hypothetical protein